MVTLAAVNVAGVRTSARLEDFIVYGKVLILLALAAIGLTAVRSAEAFPVLEESATSVVGAAGLIFVDYEGFQLLTYDYDEISAPERTLPHAIWISICFVTLLYMLIAFVLTGSVDAATIIAQEETVLAEIARPALGRTGPVLVLVAAVWHRVFPGVARPVPILGALGSLGAIGMLGHRTASREPATLAVIVAIIMTLLVLRVVFVLMGRSSRVDSSR